MSLVRFTGTLSALPPETKRALLERSFSIDEGLSVKVRALVAEVRAEGDAALFGVRPARRSHRGAGERLGRRSQAPGGGRRGHRRARGALRDSGGGR